MILSDEEIREVACPIYKTSGFIPCFICKAEHCGGIYGAKQAAEAQHKKDKEDFIKWGEGTCPH